MSIPLSRNSLEIRKRSKQSSFQTSSSPLWMLIPLLFRWRFPSCHGPNITRLGTLPSIRGFSLSFVCFGQRPSIFFNRNTLIFPRKKSRVHNRTVSFSWHLIPFHVDISIFRPYYLRHRYDTKGQSPPVFDVVFDFILTLVRSTFYSSNF